MPQAAHAPGIADVELLPGASPDRSAPPCLLVEVPHGADRSADYRAAVEGLVGPLPDGLIDFFHVNTDVGAFALGCAVAKGVVAREPRRTALVIRARIPRTLIDVNRVIDAGLPRTDGITPGLPPYVTHEGDRKHLRKLHQLYRTLTESAYEEVCGSGGLAFIPHTYAPRSVGIDVVDEHIVQNLRRVYAPELVDTWPLRPEVDLITRDGEGRMLAIEGAEDALIAGYAGLGVTAETGGTYYLHPATTGAVHAARYPGRTLCLELRRDLAARRWTPFEEMQADEGAIARLAGPIVDFLDEALRRRNGTER